MLCCLKALEPTESINVLGSSLTSTVCGICLVRALTLQSASVAFNT